MRNTKLMIMTMVTAVALAGCMGGGAKGSGPVLAKVGGSTVTQGDLDKRLASFPSEVKDALQQPENQARILDQLIDETLILQAAKDSKVQQSDDFKNQLDELKKQLVISLFVAEEIDKKVAVSENDLQAYYQQNKAAFEKGAQRRARHILVATKDEALAVIKALKVGADFSTLAAKRSQDPGTKDKGGDLGWFARGQLVPEFESAVYGMKKGELSRPVKTQFGFHVIKLEDLSPAVSYDQARTQIQQLLVNQQKQALTTKLLEKLRSDYKVEKVEKKAEQ